MQCTRFSQCFHNKCLPLSIETAYANESFRCPCRTVLRILEMLESLAGCRTSFLFAVLCKIGALEHLTSDDFMSN